MFNLREHLYLWCHDAGVYNQGIPNLHEKSTMSPVEAAQYMGIENIIMVTYGGKPMPPFRPVQAQFGHLRNVVWSVIGDAACAYENPEGAVDEVISLKSQYPNVTGGIMDDFFAPDRQFDLDSIVRKMHRASLPLWVVVYDEQLGQSKVWEALNQCDVITFWTWKIRNIAAMEETLLKLHQHFPDKRIVAGCYLWNFGDDMNLTIRHAQYEFNVALDYLRSGIISDMIILGSPLVGMNLPTIPWARQWIQENG